MKAPVFYHALGFRKEVCIGCSHCMNVCPTQAIRIKGGKAHLTDNRCVDCGKCYLVCPVGAIIVKQDDFNRIFDHKYKVALIPNVLPGQFPESVPFGQICKVLKNMGFTHIFEVEHGTRILSEAMEKKAGEPNNRKPLISTFCPAIVRLIQVRFPIFIPNLLLMKTPLDVSAMFIRRQLEKDGAKAKEVGVFYITPCAAKIAAIKSPVGEESSPITGVINMDFIYNKIYTKIKQGQTGDSSAESSDRQDLKPTEMLWSLTGGEADCMPGRSLAIDGINHVIEFLEKLENEENKDIDFLELRACDQSCAGGILTSENRFFTVERIRKRAIEARKTILSGETSSGFRITDEKEYLMANLPVQEVKPRSMDILDEDMGKAMSKMKRVQQLMEELPMVDCGICGSPTCSALAEDIVQGDAALEQCIYVQKRWEQQGKMMANQSTDILRTIWGDDKFENKNSAS